MAQAPGTDAQLKIMAGIGFVCLQWSLLEHTMLWLIATIEGIPLEKAYRIFAGLDMVPRCGMAISLAKDAGAPNAILLPIRTVREAIRKERLDHRRNAIVHGVHAYPDDTDSVTLTLPRNEKSSRTQVVTTLELLELGQRFHALTEDTLRAGDQFFEWKIRVQQNRLEDAKRKLRSRNVPAAIRLAQNAYSRAKRFAGNFKR